MRSCTLLAPTYVTDGGDRQPTGKQTTDYKQGARQRSIRKDLRSLQAALVVKNYCLPMQET